MNSDNFAEFLSDKSNLYKLSYQELKTLTLQYPYSSNLQLLLTLKSKMEQHKDFEKNLARAATLCPDRKHLLLRLETIEVDALQTESLLLKEDYLELKDLSSLEELDKIPVEPEVEVEQNGHHEVVDSIQAQLQHDSSEEDPTDNNPFLNSSGKDYEDINLSDTLLKDLLAEDMPPSQEEEQTDDSPAEADPEAEILPSFSEPVISPEDEQGPLLPEVESYSAPEEELEETITEAEPSISLKPKPEPLLPPALPYRVPADLILNLVAISKIRLREQEATISPVTPVVHAEIAGNPSNAEGMPKPSPKSSFTSWVQQFQPEHTKLRLAELMEAKKLEELKRKKKLKAKKRKKKKKKNKAIIIAEQSIIENSEIATETLAELLTQQEQYGKAIQAYQRLIEIYPEKKAHYQTKIFQIQNKDQE